MKESINHFQFSDNPEFAFRLIVRSYQEKVFRFISLFVGSKSECEELASDVFITLWNQRESLHEIENLDNYIFIVARNKALNHLRKSLQPTIDLDELNVDVFHNTTTNPESIYISQETVEELNSAINELPQKTRMAFILVRENKMKYKDAADILGVSVKTLEKQVASAIEKLKNKLRSTRKK
ncbi:MAG: sigma-70 family RNA polymerase sigma factor [Paludibacter sp.]|jgi:RNA polymerase sigma-70 factor (ECF subfamily)|nr:sigma-70 family RNA polymerase sigma factor [Paludibacter sp.]